VRAYNLFERAGLLASPPAPEEHGEGEHPWAGERQQLIDAVELAWGIIANASGGDWTKEREEWQTAACRWADRFLPMLGSALASPPAPVERCGAVTTFGGAFPPMVCTLPMGHTGRHDADSAAPAPVEGERERVAAEVWIGGAYPDERDHPQTRRIWREVPRTDVTVRRAYETADRILAALPVEGSVPYRHPTTYCPAHGTRFWCEPAGDESHGYCSRCALPVQGAGGGERTNGCPHLLLNSEGDGNA
jgi:hypothetical protein